MTASEQKPLRVFCSYSHKDEEYLNVLRTWLRGLEWQQLIEWWHDREISPGWEWEEAIDKNLRIADIILLLVTPDFMGSKYVYEQEIGKAVQRHDRGKARVIPIIVLPSYWEWTPFGKLQALPKDAKPITTWGNKDEAWLDVLRGVRKAVQELIIERQEQAAREQYRKAVQAAWADNKLSDAEAERLGTMVSELRLSADTAADIEREVIGDTIVAILESQERAAREEEEKEQRERLDERYAEARRLHQDQKWQAVIEVFEQIRAEDPTYPDREGLLASARAELEVQERARRVAAIYAEGRRHMDAKEWQLALESFEEVERLEPGYRETEALREQVRHELEEGEKASQYREALGSAWADGELHSSEAESLMDLANNRLGLNRKTALDIEHEVMGDTIEGILQRHELAATERAAEEPGATDAARRRAEELGIDLAEVQASGPGGLITLRDVTSTANKQAAEKLGADISQTESLSTAEHFTVDDVVGSVNQQSSTHLTEPPSRQTDGEPLPTRAVQESQQAAQSAQDAAGQAAQQAQDTAGQDLNITDAARQKADELGVDLSQVEATGAEGRITVRDVTSAANQPSRGVPGPSEPRHWWQKWLE